MGSRHQLYHDWRRNGPDSQSAAESGGVSGAYSCWILLLVTVAMVDGGNFKPFPYTLCRRNYTTVEMQSSQDFLRSQYHWYKMCYGVMKGECLEEAWPKGVNNIRYVGALQGLPVADLKVCNVGVDTISRYKRLHNSGISSQQLAVKSARLEALVFLRALGVVDAVSPCDPKFAQPNF